MDTNRDLLSVGIAQILADLVFPAHRWQVIAQAQYYGAGYHFLQVLDRLPTRTYLSVADVVAQLTAVPAPVLTPRRPPAPAMGRPTSPPPAALRPGRLPRAPRPAPRLAPTPVG